MKFGKRNNTPTRLANLLSAFCDGRITEVETNELRSYLEISQEARRYYLHYLDMHLDLVRRAEIQQILPISTDAFAKNSLSLWQRPWLHAAATMTLLLVFVILLLRPSSSNETSAGGDPIAFVSRADSVVLAANPSQTIEVGSLLPEGRLRLERGDLRLDFFNGVALTLQGPIDCDLRGVDQITLHRGRLAALVPESASGFAVRTPDAMIIDIGREFALNVLPNDISQVHAVEGEVIASLAGKGGFTLEQSIIEGESFEVNPASDGVHAIKAKPGLFVAMLSPAPKVLTITNAYVAAVKAAEPVGYWRFEQVDNGIVRNEMCNRYPARVVNSQAFELEGNADNKVAVLPEGKETGGLRVDEPFEELNVSGRYSIELWMNPLKHDWSALVSLIRSAPMIDRNRPEPHLLSLECMPPSESNCWVDHEPRVLRCNQLRSCRGQGPGQSANLFTERRYVPGQWRHLVVTRDDCELSFYLDGVLESGVEIDIHPDDSDYHLLMGRKSDHSKRFAKLFAGRLDEVAFYDRVLTSEEIETHYRLAHP